MRRALGDVEVEDGEAQVLGQEVRVQVRLWVVERDGNSRDGRRMEGGLRVGVELHRVRGLLYEETHLLIGDDGVTI